MIAAKYKEYSRLKSLESSLSRRENRRQDTPENQSKKRNHASTNGPDNLHPEFTPRKSAKARFATPSHNRTAKLHPSQLDTDDTPSTFRKLFSPSTHKQNIPAPSPLRSAIGPTPQRDGKALGLFDLLSESGGSTATPSGKKQENTLAAAFRTPSKRKTVEPIPEVPEEEQQETPRLARTPASSAKQFYLANLFATPTTMRYAAMVEADDDKDAEEHQQLDAMPATAPQEETQSGTPSFLRRSNSGRYLPSTSNHDGSGLTPMVSRKPPQFAGRGLSHLVQGLRDMETRQLDDEWDVLREIEAEQEAPNVDVADSQVATANEKQQPYKKKGQKRTTRRVIMRPVVNRPKPRNDPIVATNEENEASDDELATVPETHLPAGPKDTNNHDDQRETNDDNSDDVVSLHTEPEPEVESDAEPDADFDGDPEYDEDPKPIARTKSFSQRLKEAVASAVKPKAKETVEKKPRAPEKEKKKPRPRKVNPEAHANYRSLKIRNRGSKSRGGRFRRR